MIQMLADTSQLICDNHWRISNIINHQKLKVPRNESRDFYYTLKLQFIAGYIVTSAFAE